MPRETTILNQLCNVDQITRVPHLHDGVKLCARSAAVGQALEDRSDLWDGGLQLRERHWFPTGEIKSTKKAEGNCYLPEIYLESNCSVRQGLILPFISYILHIGHEPWYINIPVGLHLPLQRRVRWQTLLLSLFSRVSLKEQGAGL